jgi:formylglycine-generating enzyme required for sulfatase activity
MGALDSPELRELAGNPLYLTLMALLFERGEAPKRNRARLYDQVFELLLGGKHRLLQAPIDHPKAVRQALAYLGFSMTVDNRDAEPREQLEARLYQPEASEVYQPLERVPRWRHGLQPFFSDIAEKTGILGPHDGRDADWRFWHRTFREALAAEQLAEEYSGKEGPTSLLTRARAITAQEDLSRWAEPFALLVGRIETADELVHALVVENQPLGLRALATAQNLKDETLREVLALTEKWGERRAVYALLPELVGEPGRALRLLDQLRRRTHNGNDLFFLDHAVQEVARRFPENAHEATELRTRLYDHIPAPPEELFQWIDTPINGRVPLWREIPAGRFEMGSPQREGIFDERPLHNVKIERAFRCSVCPVTQAQFIAFDSTQQFQRWKGVRAEELPHHPLVGVTWYEAISFCRWLSATFPWARGARLPVEAEWEYACRAGSRSRYWSGEKKRDLSRVSWYEVNSGLRTHRVGEKPANPRGLYDVHGNVWEWMLNPFTDSYAGREEGVAHDPLDVQLDAAASEAVGGGRRVIRGGCFRSNTIEVRAAFRAGRGPGGESGDLGFRVVIPPAPSSSTAGHSTLEFPGNTFAGSSRLQARPKKSAR